MKNRAQIQLQFNWIFILIAGAVILFFFFGIVLKQKDISEERLEYDVTQIIESILVGAGVSEKTKNLIDIPSQYEFYFTCRTGNNPEGDARKEFGIAESNAKVDLPIEPIFAPGSFQSSKLVTWSLPVKLPYKVGDILLITSPLIKYVVVGDEGRGFRQELEKDVMPREGDDQLRVAEGFTFQFPEEGGESCQEDDHY